MKNSTNWLVTIGLVVCLLTACTGTKNVTIKPNEYSEKEQTIISNAGGAAGNRFKMQGNIPSTQQVEVTVEQYEGGKLTSDEPFTWLDPDFGLEGEVSFAIATKNQNGIDKVFITMPSTKLTMNMNETDLSAYSYGALVDKKITLELNKPVYVAYGVGNKDTSIITLRQDEKGKVNVEDYDYCLLLKMEVKEK